VARFLGAALPNEGALIGAEIHVRPLFADVYALTEHRGVDVVAATSKTFLFEGSAATVGSYCVPAWRETLTCVGGLPDAGVAATATTNRIVDRPSLLIPKA
jgi:hypothetical protein